MILFRDNVTSPEQLRALTRSLREAGGDDTLVAVDQEGGEIRILPWAPPLAAAPAQQAAGTVRCRRPGRRPRARRARRHVTLAPVGDVPDRRRRGTRQPRVLRRPRDRVARRWPRPSAAGGPGGVLATAKHFPGLGGATVNTDDGPATIDALARELDAVDLPPFAAAIEAGVPLVMIGHARYPALDPDRIASQSAPILRDLLRGDLGFEGVVVTDSMEAPRRSPPATSRRSPSARVRAGADLLLLTGQGSFAPVSEHLLDVARGSAGFRLRVRESAARVLELQATAILPRHDAEHRGELQRRGCEATAACGSSAWPWCR